MKQKLKLLFAASILLLSFYVGAQEPISKEQAEKWFDSKEWLGGLQMAPHQSINKLELAIQYQKNKELWDKVFEFLKTNDLKTLENKKFFIDSTYAWIAVSEYQAKEFEVSKWESHKKYLDIQIVAEGVEKIGVTPLENTTGIDTYNDKKDVAFLQCDNGEYFVATPGTFFIFFPQDAHRPGIKTEGSDKIKKIVVKLRYN